MVRNQSERTQVAQHKKQNKPFLPCLLNLKFSSHLLAIDPAIVLPVGLLEAPGTPASRVQLRRAVEGLVSRLVASPTVVNLCQGAVSAGAARASRSGARAGVLRPGLGNLCRLRVVLLRKSLQCPC